MRITFEEVAIHGEKSFKCPDCNKRRTRRKKFSQTINPYNRNAEGKPKDSYEIVEELREQRKQWYESPPESCCREVNP